MTATIGLQVWFLKHPDQLPVRGIISAIHKTGQADIEFGCEGISSTHGVAWGIRSRDEVQSGRMCWWPAEQAGGEQGGEKP